MPGPGTGPRPCGWETLLYKIRHSARYDGSITRAHFIFFIYKDSPLPKEKRSILLPGRRKPHIFAVVDCVWNVMAQAQKPDFVFPRNGRVHLNRKRRQFSRLLATEVCASAVVMLDTPSSEVVKDTSYPLHSPLSPSLPLPAPPCAITFQLDSNSSALCQLLQIRWWRKTML